MMMNKMIKTKNEHGDDSKNEFFEQIQNIFHASMEMFENKNNTKPGFVPIRHDEKYLVINSVHDRVVVDMFYEEGRATRCSTPRASLQPRVHSPPKS